MRMRTSVVFVGNLGLIKYLTHYDGRGSGQQAQNAYTQHAKLKNAAGLMRL
jgi:hypothetical protein